MNSAYCDFGCTKEEKYSQGSYPYGWTLIPNIFGAKECCDRYKCRLKAGLEPPPLPATYTPVSLDRYLKK